MSSSATRLTAAILGLAAFSVSILAGLFVDNPLDAVLARALFAMLTCSICGAVLGAVAHHAVNSRLHQLKVRDGATPAQSPAHQESVTR